MTEPEERIEEAIARCHRLEADAAPLSNEGLPNDIARAQGEVSALVHIRELLEQELPGGSEWPVSLWNCELRFHTDNHRLLATKHVPSNVHDWTYDDLLDALQVGIAKKVEIEVLDGTRAE